MTLKAGDGGFEQIHLEGQCSSPDQWRALADELVIKLLHHIRTLGLSETHALPIPDTWKGEACFVGDIRILAQHYDGMGTLPDSSGFMIAPYPPFTKVRADILARQAHT